MELPGLTCHLGEVSEYCVKCRHRAAERRSWRSWGIVWVEKEVFYVQHQHRGREKEVFRVAQSSPSTPDVEVGRIPMVAPC